MGLSTSSIAEPLSNLNVDKLQDEILRQARQLTAAATCSYEEFQTCLKELNSLSSMVTGTNGKRLFFAVKRGSDTTVLWRATVRIAVIQTNCSVSEIHSHRFLTLPQFLQVFSTLQNQMVSALEHSSTEEEPANPASSSSTVSTSGTYQMTAEERRAKLSARKELSYSRFLDEIDEIAAESREECCICLERRPEIMLPCAHAFCTICIERWNSSHKTCPICRETIETTDDAWVISDIPGTEDINREICSALMTLSSDPQASKA